MYQLIKDVIEAGYYELADILKKIETVWIQAGITEAQRNELIALARTKADPQNSYGSIQKQIDALGKMITVLTARIEALEGKEPGPDDTWPEYVQPTGSHDAYFSGDRITYNGKRYICTAPEGVACVWAPDTYPAYWEEQGL